MLAFISSMFTGLGFVIFLCGVGYLSVTLFEAISNAKKKRQERYDRLIAAIEKVQTEIRDQNAQR